MKKIVATMLGVCGAIACASAQGTFVIDSGLNLGNGSAATATTGGLVWLDHTFGDGPNFANAVLNTGTDINLSVMWGASADAVNNTLNLDPLNLNGGNTAWLASKPSGAGDMTSYGGGAIFDPNGNSYVVPGQAAGNTIFVVMQGWTGSATSFGAAGGSDLKGSTTPFQITLAANTSPTQPDTHNMGALVLQPVPEPGMLALAGLGAAALMAARRRK